MKRHGFCVGVFLVLLLPVFGQQAPDFDVIIKGGAVYDGTGREAQAVDVAIRGGRIAGLGDFSKASAAIAIAAISPTLARGAIASRSPPTGRRGFGARSTRPTRRRAKTIY